MEHGKYKHGMSGGTEHNAWQNMLARCLNPKNPRYAQYGGRGIQVCARWQGNHGFTHFFADMGSRPSAEHSLDRVDNDGPYSPENCRWTLENQQQRNRTNNNLVTFRGETLCLKDWSARLGIDYGTLRHRLRRGMTVEAAFTTPPGPSGKKYKRDS